MIKQVQGKGKYPYPDKSWKKNLRKHFLTHNSTKTV